MPSVRQIQHPSEEIHCPFSCQKGVALWGWVSKTMCMLFSILFTGEKKVKLKKKLKVKLRFSGPRNEGKKGGKSH
jgi:hypothetical protein